MCLYRMHGPKHIYYVYFFNNGLADLMVDVMPVAILVLCDNDQAEAHFEDTIESVAISRFSRIRQHITAPLHVVK